MVSLTKNFPSLMALLVEEKHQQVTLKQNMVLNNLLINIILFLAALISH